MNYCYTGNTTSSGRIEAGDAIEEHPSISYNLSVTIMPHRLSTFRCEGVVYKVAGLGE